MPALANPALWRTSPYKTKTFLYLSRPATLLAARVNMASPTFPLTSLDFDGTTSGSYTNVLAGHTLLLGSSAGASDKGLQRVRVAPSSTNIPVGRSSNGVFVGELAVADNLYITVLKERRLWAKIPRITAAYELLKDEQSYSDALALAPVVIMGSDFAARVNASTGKLTVTFDFSASYAVASGATISTYLSNFDGGTIIAGTTATSTATVEFDPGEYEVSLTVTDSGGKTSTGYRWIVAVDRTPGNTYAAIPVEAGGRALRYDGQTVSVTVKTGSIPYATYPRGTRAILFQEETYGTTAGSLNDTARGSVKFTGWLSTEPAEIEARREGRIKQVTLDLVDIGARLRQVPQFPQVLHRKTTATTWAHAKSEIANLDGAILYYLRHHTTALDIADFRRSSYQSLYTFSLLDAAQGSPFEQCDRLAMAMRGHLTINSRGQLAVKSYPNYLPTAAQATAESLAVQRTTTTIVALGESDWQRVRYTDGQLPGIHWNNGSAILISTQQGDADNRTDVPLFTVAPGEAPGQGVTAQDSGEQLALSQAELNVIEGNRYAANNAELSTLELDLTRGGDAGIEPADMEWVTLTVSSDTAAQRGLTLTDQKMLPIEVNYDLSPLGVQKQRVMLERESSGEIATTVVRDVAPLPPHEDPPFNDDYTPPVGWLFPPAGVSGLTLILNNGTFPRTENFNTSAVTGGPNYTINSPTGAAVGGTPVQWCVDPRDTANGWLLTSTEIGYVTDIHTAPVYAQQFSGFLAASALRNMDADYINSPGLFLVVGSAYNPNVRYTVSTDGSTWAAETLLANGVFSSAPGVGVSTDTAGRAWICGPDGGGGTGIYQTTNSGASFAILLNLLTVTNGASGLTQPFDTLLNRLFYGAGSGATTNKLKRGTIDTGETNITPTSSGTDYGPELLRVRFTIAVATNSKALMVVATDITQSAYGVFYTADREAATVVWQTVVEPSASVEYRRCALSPDGSAAYLFGINGAMGYWDGYSVDNRTGDLVTSAEILGIAG